MPIYEYVCTACDHRADILHGINDPGPHFCPSCGNEGTMQKRFAPPAILFKGSGWAKKDRAATARKSAAGPAGGEAAADGAGAAAGSAAEGGTAESTATAKASGTAEPKASGTGAAKAGPSAGSAAD